MADNKGGTNLPNILSLIHLLFNKMAEITDKFKKNKLFSFRKAKKH